MSLVALASYTGSLHENTRLFTGREYDKETQLYFLRARYYSPSTGRFISRDPVGQNDQINLYTYVGNSPMMYVDRMGREAKKFIAENEGNVWYIKRNVFNSDENDGKTTVPHASMYFIKGGREYLISYAFRGPTLPSLYQSLPGDSASNNERAYQADIDYERNLILHGTSNNSEDITKINSRYVDAQKMVDFMQTQLNSENIPNYNLYTNNCSDIARQALIAGGFFETPNSWDSPVGTTPSSLQSDIKSELKYKLIKGLFQATKTVLY